MALFSLSLLVCLSLFSYSLADRCSSIPSTMWCGNDKLEEECGFQKFCQRYRVTTHNKPVELTVLMEGKCPGCQAFIIDVLYPIIYKNFKSYVNIEIVPFGNAKFADDGSIVCQHGPEECQINRFESCLIDSVESQEDYVPLIYCLETQIKAGVALNMAADKCFRQHSVGDDVQRLVQSCLVSSMGARLQKKAGEKTENVWPEKHTHVPWVVYNNVSLGSAQMFQNQIPQLICQWYTGDHPIPYCKNFEKEMNVKTSPIF